MRKSSFADASVVYREGNEGYEETSVLCCHRVGDTPMGLGKNNQLAA